jgi:hypothetical protein
MPWLLVIVHHGLTSLEHSIVVLLLLVLRAV